MSSPLPPKGRVLQTPVFADSLPTLVHEAGLEPAKSFPYQILSLACFPISPLVQIQRKDPLLVYPKQVFFDTIYCCLLLRILLILISTTPWISRIIKFVCRIKPIQIVCASERILIFSNHNSAHFSNSFTNIIVQRVYPLPTYNGKIIRYHALFSDLLGDYHLQKYYRKFFNIL